MLGLRQAMSKYCAEKKSAGDWSPIFEKLVGYTFRRALAYLGDQDLEKIDRDSILAFRMALQEQGVMASSVNQELTVLGGLFNWAVDLRYIQFNPIVRMRVKDRRPKGSKRGIFTNAELQAIFSGNYRDQNRGSDAKFWCPLLMVHQGLRAGEAAQLMGYDVAMSTEGIWTVKVQPLAGRKVVKSENAIRELPIHPKLIDLGFVDYARRHGPDDHLFNIRRSYRGSMADFIGRAFKAHMRRLGIGGNRSLYSLRHQVASIMKQQLVPE